MIITYLCPFRLISSKINIRTTDFKKIISQEKHEYARALLNYRAGDGAGFHHQFNHFSCANR